MSDGQAGFIDLTRRFERAIVEHRLRLIEPKTETERAVIRIAEAEEARRNGGKGTPA